MERIGVARAELEVEGAVVVGEWAGLGISLVGLGVVIEAVESRVGRRRASRVRGLLTSAPGLAFFFLVFAASMAGFPGTAGFVGEDLVPQGAAHPAGALRAALLLATAFNGMTMLRMFGHVFLGPPAPAEAFPFPESTRRERVVLGSLALTLAGLVALPAAVLM